MKIFINNEPITVPEELSDISLLNFLRDFAGLKGAKFGCGIGLCGACTVHLDGAAVRACLIWVSDVADQQVTTIEGLADAGSDKSLHPVQKAWIEESVPQCGYCQPGQIMTATALLRSNPNPTSVEIREEMNGNLCRCGTYPRIYRAIRRVVRESKNDGES